MNLKRRNLNPEVFDFFDEKTNAASYIVKDPSSATTTLFMSLFMVVIFTP